ncbi:hypothetical protein ELG72_03690 [Rhizobium leguminosarum]|nr:hypothetical protein [Rhizobium leguminosarum bv. viciae]TBF39220.1 hypothetical protein ELG92_03670 [Rhizobium leguminosarum]TBF55594.1 hypothetical protein ELG87_03675 [Rhizobium leguminosarum]TBF76692.1 hypothetical protein ELG89_03675 [Rhizobium leguminosarum]TBF81332.1 hypothetical protein ELG86_03880 [Rhizobium leguminosarum]
MPSTIFHPLYKRFLEASCLFRGAFHDGLRWSISAAQTKIDWVSAVLMHFSTPDAGNFNKITAMVWPEGTRLPISGRAHHGLTWPDFLQR